MTQDGDFRASSSLSVPRLPSRRPCQRGHHIVYRANASNHCPGCGRSQWYIGRVSAECGFCGTAVPLAETACAGSDAAAGRAATTTIADQRRFPRMAAKGRKLKLLIDGSPKSFALHNISEGGAMGAVRPNSPRRQVHVRFEAASSCRRSSDGPRTGSSASPSPRRSSSTGRQSEQELSGHLPVGELWPASASSAPRPSASFGAARLAPPSLICSAAIALASRPYRSL